MAHAFFEAWDLVVTDVQLADEHVQIAALVTHVDAQSRGVVDDDDGQCHGHSESARSHPVIVTDGSDEGDDETGVSRRHVAVSHGVAPIPAVFGAKNNEFSQLHDKTDKNLDEEDIIF